MTLNVLVVLLGCTWLVSGQFSGFQNVKLPRFATETSKKLDSLTERIEKEGSEAKEILEDLQSQVKALQKQAPSVNGGTNVGSQGSDQVSEMASKVSRQEKQIESVSFRLDSATKEVASLKGNLATVKAEAEQSNAKVAAMEQTVKEISTRVVATDDHVDKSLVSVKGQLSDFEKTVHDQQRKAEQQCSNTEQQNSALFDSIPVPGKLETLIFEDASSSTWSTLAGLAIDGNRDSNLMKGSCTKTDPDDPQPWWQGSLKTKSEVHRLTLTNRGDCCSERLRNFKIEGFVDYPTDLNDAQPILCKEVDQATEPVTIIECDQPIVAKYIRITKHNAEQLTLCEVQAEGYVLPKKPQGLPIQSSSASFDSGAKMATDSNPDTCSQTQNEGGSAPWWQVDLTEMKQVNSVSITNRKDADYIWLTNLKVKLYDTLPSTCSETPSKVCASFDQVGGHGEVVTLTCDPPVTGRYMRISKKDGGTLSFCEVRIKTEN